MRVTALIALAICLLVGSPGRADAEKVKTNQTTKLYARPGEQAKVLVTVKSGQNMTLLAKDGRWLKVRVNGRTGYVPRSKVDMADDDEIARNTRRRPFVDGRSRRRGFGGDAPDDRVGADATGEGQDDEGDKKGGGGNDDEDEEDPDTKKPTAKKPDKKPAAKASSKSSKDEGDDEGDDEEDPDTKKPDPKKAVKAVAKTPAKPAAKTVATKGDDESDDESSDDEEDADTKKPAAKAAAKKGDGDEDEEDSSEKRADERPKAHVLAKKVSVYDKPDTDSNEEFVVRPNDTLYTVESKGDFTKVETEDGDRGWIESAELEMVDGGGGPGGSGKKAIDLRAGFGLMFIQQGMRTAGSTNLNVPDNYNIGTSSLALSVGAGILVPKGKKLLLGGEFTYDYAKTAFGGVFYDADGKGGAPGVNIGVTIHNVNFRGVAGIDLKKKSGMALFAHLGYRYQGFLVTDVASMAANPARLPSEVVKAPTLGAALSIPRLTDKVGMKFALDAIVFGAGVKQTQGLEDGSSPSVKAVVVGANLTYHWKQKLDLQALYNLEYMAINFGAPLASSTRGHMGTSVARTDFFHVITVGISKPF